MLLGQSPWRLSLAARDAVPGYGRVTRRVDSLLADRRAPLIALALICALGVGARSFHLGNPAASHPGQGYVFDEHYYVSAARVIAGIPTTSGDVYRGAAPVGADPNAEHPQLGKLIIAAGMKILGDNTVGWRITAVIFGAAAILLLYWLVRCAGGGPWMAVAAAGVASFENLWVVHSRIAVLDIYVVPFMLAAAAFYLLRRPVIAGVLVGIGCCVKEFAVYVLFIVALLELMRGVRALISRRSAAGVGRHDRDAGRDLVTGPTARGPIGDQANAGAAVPRGIGAPFRRAIGAIRPGIHTTGAGIDATGPGIDATGPGIDATGPSLKRPLITWVVAGVVFFSLLAALDQVTTPYSGGHPVDRNQAGICQYTLVWESACNHFVFMQKYASKLRDVGGKPRGIASTPLDFWIDRKEITYYKTTRTVTAGGVVRSNTPIVWYRGEVGRVVLYTSWLAILACMWWAFRRGDQVALLALAWILGAWLPPALGHLIDSRTTYLYYMVVVMPGLYIAVARLLSVRRIPRLIIGLWVAALLWDFASLYPFRTFSGT